MGPQIHYELSVYVPLLGRSETVKIDTQEDVAIFWNYAENKGWNVRDQKTVTVEVFDWPGACNHIETLIAEK